MKPLDKPSTRSSAAVDDILEELKGKGRPAAAGGASLDDIMAELGMPAGAPRPKTPPKEAGATGPGSPEVRQRLVALTGNEKAAAQRPRPAAKTPPPGLLDLDVHATGQMQAVQQKEQPAAPSPAKKAPAGDTTILDIEVQHSTGATGRVGKAAALDRVDHDKYSGDTELLSWFSGEEDTTALSPREQRRREKELKKQEAAERRAARKRPRKEEAEPEDELPPLPDSLELPVQPAAAVRPLESGARIASPDDDSPLVSWEEPETASPAASGGLLGEDAPAGRPEAFPGAAAFRQPTTAPAPQTARPATAPQAPPKSQADPTRHHTRGYEKPPEEAEERVPTAAFTQEFEAPIEADGPQTEPPGWQAAPAADPQTGPVVGGESKSLYLDDMVDDRFRAFFGETVIVDQEDMETPRRKRKRGRTRSLFTGEFAQLEQQMGEAEGAQAPDATTAPDDENDYNHPGDAPAVEKQLQRLRTSLLVRLAVTGVAALLLWWLGLGFGGAVQLPAFLAPLAAPVTFGIIYLVLVLVVIGVNFTTVAAGLVGLVGEPTVDSAPALAAVAALLQAVVALVTLVTGLPGGVSLFGGLAALILCFCTLGKWVRAGTILANFSLASAGFDHCAAYIVDGRQEIAYNITDGLEEDDPVLLVSRPTALVKGFMRQSFSLRWSDGIGRILGWALAGAAIVAAVISYILTRDMLAALSSFAAVLCIGAPFSSTLVSAVPSLVMQHNTSKVGAVVPGWTNVQELGDVNVVMAGGRDIFPPQAVKLKGIKTFQKERIDVAILYAASVLIEGCETMRDIFLGVIQGKSDMLYKVESLTTEPGRGFTAWVENHRVVIGTREMLQKHDVTPPSVESELQYLQDGCRPVYLAVSGKLFAMFVVKYSAEPEVRETLAGLVRSGVSLLVTTSDMNVSEELITSVYNLPEGVVKVLGRRELDMLEPMTSYLPESDGVMTHIGSFTSFIGGMSAAAGCAASERMSVILQVASVAVAVLLSLVLVFFGGLASLSFTIILLFQLGWTVLVCALPFARRL